MPPQSEPSTSSQPWKTHDGDTARMAIVTTTTTSAADRPPLHVTDRIVIHSDVARSRRPGDEPPGAPGFGNVARRRISEDKRRRVSLLLDVDQELEARIARRAASARRTASMISSVNTTSVCH